MMLLRAPLLLRKKHNDLLMLKAQEKFGNLKTTQELHEAAGFII